MACSLVEDCDNKQHCSLVEGCDIKPPCPVQLSPTGTELPKRICYEMAWRTVDCFLGNESITEGMVIADYGWEYPAPIGERAIARWLQGREENDRLTQEAYGYKLGRLKIPDAPLTVSEDALLGLAVPRDVRFGGQLVGRVWLLGLVEPEDAEAMSEPQLVPIGIVTVSLDSEQADSVPTYGILEPDVEEKRPERKQPGTPPALGEFFEEERQWWRFVEPRFQTDLQGNERAKAHQTENELYKWYTKYVLGGIIRTGRTKGSIALPDFPARYRQAYQKLLDRDSCELPTRLEVAMEVGISAATFYRYLRDIFKLDWPPKT